VVAVAPLTLLWVRLNQPEWPGTGGWIVHGDPRHPGRSRLHSRGNENRLSDILIAGCCVVVSGVYCFAIYPAWRR
jgi:hypothetical protein